VKTFGRVTITDIAKKTGFSIKTVSRVINNSPNVKEETRRKILKAIEESGYSVNLLAKALKKGKTQTVIVFMDKHGGEYWSSWHNMMIREIISGFRRENYKIIVSPSSGKGVLDDETDGFLFLKSGLADGAVIFDIMREDIRIKYLRENKIPFVIVGKDLDHDDTNYVDLDNYMVGHMGGEYLIKKGKKRIVFMLGSKDFNVNRERAKGFEDACKKYGIEYEVIFELKDPEEVYRKVQEKLKEPIDAFFISGDERAMGAYKAVYEAGLKIPENVAILGIDNLPFSEYLHPPLTTIDQRVKEFAGITVKILLDAMRHWDPKVKRVVIPPRLIERGSV